MCTTNAATIRDIRKGITFSPVIGGGRFTADSEPAVTYDGMYLLLANGNLLFRFHGNERVIILDWHNDPQHTQLP